MQGDIVCYALLFALAQCYREDPSHFLSLSKQAINSALTHEIVAELCDRGHIEEGGRDTIRFTPPWLQSVPERSITCPVLYVKSGPAVIRSLRSFVGNCGNRVNS